MVFEPADTVLTQFALSLRLDFNLSTLFQAALHGSDRRRYRISGA